MGPIPLLARAGRRGRLVLRRTLLPAILRPINPVYAAQTIEQSRPSLKNSLINFLLLRQHRSEVLPVVYEGLEYRAASDLARVPVETAVDRSRVVRFGTAFAVVLLLVGLYIVFLSPKNLFTSFERLMFPWADIAPPTRVSIANVQPGDASQFYGDFVAASADVTGLRRGEGVMLYFTTADGQSVDEGVPLTPPDQGYRWQCVLPPGSAGLQQDLSYRLAAGDCRTPVYHIHTEFNPVIVVDRVDYHYPPYTGIPDRSVDREGDLRAIEGTKVTIHASANQPIDRAEIDLDCTGLPGVRMQVEGTTATAQIVLRMKPSEPTRPEYQSYQLRFADTHKRKNREPIRHRIEVLRDLPPEVQIVAPAVEKVQVPENGQVEIRVRASDPDFGFRRVALVA